MNDVILSRAKNLVFSFCYEILHFVQDDHYNCWVNSNYYRAAASLDTGFRRYDSIMRQVEYEKGNTCLGS